MDENADSLRELVTEVLLLGGDVTVLLDELEVDKQYRKDLGPTLARAYLMMWIERIRYGRDDLRFEIHVTSGEATIETIINGTAAREELLSFASRVKVEIGEADCAIQPRLDFQVVGIPDLPEISREAETLRRLLGGKIR